MNQIPTITAVSLQHAWIEWRHSIQGSCDAQPSMRLSFDQTSLENRLWRAFTAGYQVAHPKKKSKR